MPELFEHQAILLIQTECEARRRLRQLLQKHGSRKRRSVPAIRVKKRVRKRDQYRCRDCGESAQEHIERTGQTLHVHRIVPGTIYQVDSCITLCHECHAKKKNHEDEDTFELYWHFYNPDDCCILEALIQESIRSKASVCEVLDGILHEWLERRLADPITPGHSD
jgi:hypothetical protein